MTQYLEKLIHWRAHRKLVYAVPSVSKIIDHLIVQEERAEKLEELLNNIISVHSDYFDRHQRDWPSDLYKALREADDYLNG